VQRVARQIPLLALEKIEHGIVCSCCGSSLGAKNDNASCDEAPAREDAGA
jgi:hypothetical protein